MIRLCTFFTLLVCVLYQPSLAQNDSIKINDVLFSEGLIDLGAEYYVINSKNSFLENHLLIQPRINDRNILSAEVGLVRSWLESGVFTSFSDVSLSYQRNFQTAKYLHQGFQGIGAKLKFVIPTGNADYFSGFDSWSIEPLIGAMWLFKNIEWFTAINLRYNYSLSALPGKKIRDNFLSLEYALGYESDQLWFVLEPDYRFNTNNQNSDLFLAVEFAYKINNSIGARLKYKPRIIGQNFYESLLVGALFYKF